MRDPFCSYYEPWHVSAFCIFCNNPGYNQLHNRESIIFVWLCTIIPHFQNFQNFWLKIRNILHVLCRIFYLDPKNIVVIFGFFAFVWICKSPNFFNLLNFRIFYPWFFIRSWYLWSFKSSNPAVIDLCLSSPRRYLNFNFSYKSLPGYSTLSVLYTVYISRNAFVLIETRINDRPSIPLWLLSFVRRKMPINRPCNAAINMYYVDDAIFDKSPHANHVGEQIGFSVAFHG